MALTRLPEIDGSGNFTSPDVLNRLDERYAGNDGGTPSADVSASMPGLSQIAKAQQAPFRIMLSGTSIANNSNSALKTMAEWLITQHGESGAVIATAGNMSGSYVNAHRGWSKQPYGGPQFVRIAGAAGTALTFDINGYGDQVVIEWSRESDSAPFEVLVDGVSVGAVGGAGSQAYAQRTVFTVANGPHRVTINPPTTGTAYIENIEVLNTARKGVEVRDATLGGSSLFDMTTLRAVQAPQVAGIPISGDSGVNAFYDRTDVDLHLVSYTVNDAGKGLTWAQGGYKATVDKIVTKTRARGVPVVFVVEMGGHYSLTTSNNHAAFNEIRDYLLAQAVHGHVTVIDWHAATTMADKQTYMSRYYSATSLNLSTGTFSGDFIHPNKAGYRVLEGQLAQALPSSQPRRELPTQIANDRLRTMPPGGFDKLATVDGVTKRYSAPAGPTFQATSAGLNSYFQGRVVHYYRDGAAVNIAASSQGDITNSVTSDQHGKYVDWSSKTIGLGSSADWAGGERVFATIRASGTAVLRADGDVSLYADGAPIPDTDPANFRTIMNYVVGAGVEPLVFTVEIGSASAGKNFILSGRIYEVSITRTTVPVLV